MNNLQIKSTIDERRTVRVSQVRRHLKSVNFIKNFTGKHPTKTSNSQTKVRPNTLHDDEQ